MTPAPTVWVYLWLRLPDGSAYWQRYVGLGSDHAEAVRTATRNVRPSDILDVASFDGEPRAWKVDSAVSEVTS